MRLVAIVKSKCGSVVRARAVKNPRYKRWLEGRLKKCLQGAACVILDMENKNYLPDAS